MSLLGALSLGGSSLAAQQTGLQVTGNNIANAGTEGYTRQTVKLTPGGARALGNGQYLGTGVTVEAIERQANEAINESLRNATSEQQGAQTLDTLLGQIQTTFGALDENDLAARMTDFFNSFSTLATNPSNSAQQSVVVQNGASLADYLQTLRGQLTTMRTSVETQVGALVTQADSLVKTIAMLNQKISGMEAGQGTANSLRDQRDVALGQLAQIMDIRVLDQGNGMVNVLTGSMPVVTGTTARGVSSNTVTNGATGVTSTQITYGDTGDAMTVTGGKLGALLNGRDQYLTPAVATVDALAAGLISAVNTIHTQGQGTTDFSTVTGTTAVADPAAALNGTMGAVTPKNGTFNLYIKDSVSGEITTRQITVNLSGQGTQTSLNGLAAQINTAGDGMVTASVNVSGKLTLSSSQDEVTFSFGEDTSGALAALGINTFFTGSDAANIAVNQVLTDDASMLATGRNNVTGSNGNAQALALAGGAAVSALRGKSLTAFYGDYIGTLSAQAKNVSDNVTAQKAIYDTLYNQQQAISGVSMDEEALNLTKYQRAFEGSARYITVVNEMMQTVLGLIS